MMKKIGLFIFGSTAANIFMAVGVVLLGAAHYFGVNPADGSAVDPAIRGTWIHMALFIASAPGLLILLFAGDGIGGIALMILSQVIVYWTLGKAWHQMFSRCRRASGYPSPRE